MNSYYLDGFTTADNYMYTLSNKKAASSLTDDKMYSMDRGQIDIYNFSRKPGGLNYDIYTDFVVANRFKIMAAETLSKGSFVPLKTSNSNIIAYARNYNNSTVIIIANTEKTEFENIKIKVSKLNNELFAVPIKVSQNVPTVSKGEIETNLAPLETQVILFQQFALK